MTSFNLTAALAAVKRDLRITHSALDEDLLEQIAACLYDLTVCGITDPDPTDPLILAAIKLFVRREYTDDVTKADAYRQRYDALKGSLQIAAGYGGEADED